MQAAPGHDGHHAVAVIVADHHLVRLAPGAGVSAFEPVLAVAAGPARPARFRGRVAVHHPVVADPDQDLHLIQVLAQLPGDGRLVIPGVHHIQRDAPLARLPQPGRVREDLRRGGRRYIVPADLDSVLRGGPGISAEAQLGQPLPGPALDHRIPATGVTGAAVMMELPARAGDRPRPPDRGGIDAEHARPVRGPGPDQQVPQRVLIDPAPRQPLVDHAVTAAEGQLLAQVRQRRHPPRRQHRIIQLEQGIRPQRETPVQIPAEHRQLPGGGIAVRTLARLRLPRHTETHGHCLHPRDPGKEPEDDQAVAASSHADTPDKTSYLAQA